MQQRLARVLQVRHEPALVGVLTRGVLQALHAQDYVLERPLVIAHLRVLHVGVDYHHVVRRNGQELALDVELARAPHHVEDLRARVCVQCAVPVSPIFGGTDIQELYFISVNG